MGVRVKLEFGPQGRLTTYMSLNPELWRDVMGHGNAMVCVNRKISHHFSLADDLRREWAPSKSRL